MQSIALLPIFVFCQKKLVTIAMNQDLKKIIRSVPDFPKPGILFKDITPVLLDPTLLHDTIEYFFNHIDNRNVDIVAGIESRGFILAAPLAYRLGAGFVPIRKKGKTAGRGGAPRV
ncbi:MAG: hypothetical protein HC880_06920 [Bacteroidia bacterium]|nr:hypothetical protein [Bacteroidia bacterium]